MRPAIIASFQILQKCLKLVADGHCGTRVAAALCKIDRSKVQRAQKAVQDGRDPEVNGRPVIFSTSDKANLANEVEKRRI